MSEFYDPFNPFGPNFGGQEPDTDTSPGGPSPGLDPLGPPEVPPFPSDAELEDIQDAENRQELLQDIREALVNPFDLTDEQLEFFTKGTMSAEEARESLASFYGVDVPGFPENASQAYKNRIAEIISSEGLTPAEAVARQNARLAEGADANDDGVVSAEEYEEFIAEPSLPDDGNDLPPGPSQETDTGEEDEFPPFPPFPDAEDDADQQPEDELPELPPPDDTPDDPGDDTVEEEFPELPIPDDDNEPPVEDEPGDSELPPSGEIDLPPTDDETTDQSSESEEEAETEAEDQSDEPPTNQEPPGQLPGGLPPGNENPEEENDLPQLPPGDGDGDDDEESIMSRIGDFFKDIFTEGIGGAAAQALGQGGNATISNIIDVAAAAAIDRQAQEYYTDALRDASEAELEFLERMIGRQEVFRPFYNVGTGEKAPFLGYQINKLRDLINREPSFPESRRIQPEIDILPLIEEAAAIEAVDPTVNQINVADLLLGLDTGTIPEAIRTDVNLIDPFNPQDPTLRFLQDEGRRAIESAAAAEGRLNTGGTLQELQQQAIGTAAQYAGDLADIGRVQDQARLDADQQFYSQLLGSGREGFGREIDRLGAISDAQRFQDDQALQADIRRFESEADLAGTEFDMSRFANQDAIARDQTLINQLTGLVDIGRQGATGLTGNVGTFGTLGQSAYQQLGDNRAYEGLQRGNRFSNLLGGFLGS
ncbi:MAG: hypothetical protein CL997_05715 [Euryarchaeota archaeon]|nr:hypothetical protein [Euryarchaeota archaeon]